MTEGYGADCAVETSGSTPGRAVAISYVREEGESVFIGLNGGSLEVAMGRDIVLAPRSIIGSRTFSKREPKEATEVAVNHKLPLDRMVTVQHPLSEAQRAYNKFAHGAVGKHVLVGEIY